MIAAFLIICSFVGGTFYGWWIAKQLPKEEKKEEKEEVNMDMARQWANIMSYDGTERGQIGVDDLDT